MDIQAEPVVITPIAEGYLVSIKGSVHTNLAWLDNELKRVVKGKPQVVDLDLSNTPYVSSSGLGVLAAFSKGITDGGGKVRIVAVQAKVLDILRVAYLDKVFEILPNAVTKPAH